MNDPRVVAALGRLEVFENDERDGTERLAAFDQAWTLLEAVAADPAALAADRDAAAGFISNFRAHANMMTGRALGTLAELAQTAKDPQVRADSKAALAKATRDIAGRGQDISQWVTTSSETKQ